MSDRISYLVFYVDRDIPITDACVDAVEDAIREKSGEHLYLVIQTYGGSPFSAVSIMNILQGRFKKISMLVPQYAKSAGTLMALGADVIYMNERSALGPLDLPVEHPLDGSTISALDIKNAVVEISTLSNLIAKERYKTLRDKQENDFGISKVDAARIAFETATDLTKPIVEKIDPYHLHKSMRELRIARDYAIDLLTSRMMEGNTGKAIQTATRFVNIFPAHEYSIFISDARDFLNLNIGNLEELNDWTLIKDDINTLRKGKKFCIEYREKIKQSPEPATSATRSLSATKSTKKINK